MIGYKLMINVKDRWVETGEYDEYGIEIKRANPNPTVVIHRGVWSREKGQHVYREMSSREFRRITGHIIYGGSLEPRGPHYIQLNDRGRDGLNRVLGLMDRVTDRVIPVEQVARVKCLIRRKSK